MLYKYYYKMVVNFVYDVQWEYDDKLKPTINFIMFDYIRHEWNFTECLISIELCIIKLLQGP